MRTPFQELPLEQFYPPEPTSNTANTPLKHSRPNKRPHSPGSPLLCSPAKRRILRQEGIALSPRTSKVSRSSASTGRFAPAHFQSLLQGPDSPARKLEFGPARAAQDGTLNASRDISQSRCSLSSSSADGLSHFPTPGSKSTRSTRPSSSRDSTRVSADVDMVDCFSPRRNSNISPPPIAQPDPPVYDIIFHETTPNDHHSVHYPGFDVFQSSDDAMASPCSTARPDVTGDDPESGAEMRRAKEADKENAAPRRKPSKSSSAPSMPSAGPLTKCGLLSPEAHEISKRGKSKSTSVTPHSRKGYAFGASERDGSLTPMSRSLRLLDSPGSTLVSLTPGRSILGPEAMKERRRALEDELDGIYDEEDEEEFHALA